MAGLIPWQELYFDRPDFSVGIWLSEIGHRYVETRFKSHLGSPAQVGLLSENDFGQPSNSECNRTGRSSSLEKDRRRVLTDLYFWFALLVGLVVAPTFLAWGLLRLWRRRGVRGDES